jgi:hypothetical protein
VQQTPSVIEIAVSPSKVERFIDSPPSSETQALPSSDSSAPNLVDTG